MTMTSISSNDRRKQAMQRIEASRARAPVSREHAENSEENSAVNGARGIFRRGPWELAAAALIGLGGAMLMQPFAMSLFTYSFITILAGTVMFIIVSHFPD